MVKKHHFEASKLNDLLKSAKLNHADVLASVGNYLAKYGWKTGQAIAYPVTASGEKYQQALYLKHLSLIFPWRNCRH